VAEIYGARLVDHRLGSPGHELFVPVRVTDGATFSAPAIDEHLVTAGENLSILPADVPGA
jgi:hypothetical protein